MKNWDDFDHARWRVKFLQSLAQMHQTSPNRSSETWAQERTEFAERLAAAEQVLAQFPKEWHTLSQAQIPRRSA